VTRAVSIRSLSVPRASTRAPRFTETFCSQCGVLLGPGDSGVSDCASHRCGARPARVARTLPLDSALDQRLRADIARQAYAIQRFPSKRMPACDKALLVACAIALVALALWA
jgi:hypothetical protein